MQDELGKLIVDKIGFLVAFITSAFGFYKLVFAGMQKHFEAKVQIEKNKAQSIESIKRLEMADKMFSEDIKRLELLIKEGARDSGELKKALDELREDHKRFIELSLEHYMNNR